MWCPDDMVRDSWDWVGPPAWGRACFNSPEWCGGSSRRKRIVANENGASPECIIVVAADAASFHVAEESPSSSVAVFRQADSCLGTAFRNSCFKTDVEGVPQTKRWQWRVLLKSFSSTISSTSVLDETGANFMRDGHRARGTWKDCAVSRSRSWEEGSWHLQPRGDAEHSCHLDMAGGLRNHSAGER